MSSELALELSPEGSELATADPDVPVTATGRPLGPEAPVHCRSARSPAATW
ncbi:hypothetical protein I553_5039 [Mycobacterium xenopi 4042]|uniref:Uncharacterized protein n=1 Tax=Mycobacterium xenopi 4042 TaxID=1299334 RepID=X7ZU00_MYCXE|nr:hypothetical protein I553_5039 [Mycobacterium xenopi 4042]